MRWPALILVLLTSLAAAACGGSKATPTTTATRAPVSQSTSFGQARPAAGDLTPATFTIRRGGALSPSSVSAVTAIPVELTMISGDGKAYTAVLHAPTPHTLHVPAGGRAAVRLTGLKAGRYRISIDGTTEGTLVLGFEPGP